LRVAWLLGGEQISWSRPYVWLTLGVRGAGKSSFLEHLAEQHLESGNCVLDLFACRAGENLAWLRSKWAKEKRILLLSDENAIVEAPDSIAVKPYTKLSLKDFEDFDLIINSSPLYRSLDAEYSSCNYIIDRLWHRLHWSRLIFTVCREASSLMYSRLKVVENQQSAKAFLIYWLRESRHVGCSLGLDSVRLSSLDVDVRSLADYTVFKSLGSGGLPRELWFIYRYIEPSFLQSMKQSQFVILSRRGHLGVGVFPYPTWHKTEGEDILSKLRIKVVFEEKPEEGVFRGRYTTLSDQEHADLIDMYVNQGLSMGKIAERMKRSDKSVFDHINKHTKDVLRIGYCPKCRRAGSKLDTTPAKPLRLSEHPQSAEKQAKPAL
jgi:hypothetical protein